MFFTEALVESVKKTPGEGRLCRNILLEPKEQMYREAIRYLGYKSETDLTPEIDDLVRKGLDEICSIAEPRTIYRYFFLDGQKPGDFSISKNSNSACSSGACSISLQQYEGVILMGATLGGSVDRLLSRIQIRNISYALVLDSCATAAIEAICDDLQNNLTAIYAAQNRYLTNRYSPGYGDLPLSAQIPLLQMLDTERKIGLSLTPSFLLTPSKSVTAIIGVSTVPQKKEHVSCDICEMRHVCHFRRREVSL
ncbi:MAG: hypothetical protein LBB29_02780 [Holosporaceae bacterium]|jgi:hypothetical protein|nr:hypothetical protein [Holosporaceae bacterium]